MRFVFAHGGFRAGWCWERTIAELDRLGHSGVAVDLPGHGARMAQESTLDARRDAIVSVMQPDDVFVGHSGGGFDATLAADAAPELVRHIVYSAAALPREGRSYPEAMTMSNKDDGEINGDVGEMLGLLSFAEDGAMTFNDFAKTWEYFYHDCDEETARWAFDQLGPERFGETTVLPVSIPRFWAADLLRSFIVCLQDPGHAALARRHGGRTLGCPAALHGHVPLAVPQSARRTGGPVGTCGHDESDGTADSGLADPAQSGHEAADGRGVLPV